MQINYNPLTLLIKLDQTDKLRLLDVLGKPLTWFLVGVILHSIGLIYVLFSPDSMHYVDLARNFANGLGLVTFNLNLTSQSIPDWITFFPPLYPLLLSLGFWLGMGPAGAARLVSMASFVVILLCVYTFGRRLKSPEVGTLATSIWVIMVSRWSVSLYAWSDPPFIAFSCLALLTMINSIEKGRVLAGRFFVAGLLSGMAASTRLIAMTLAPCGLLAALLVASRCRDPQKRPWLFLKSCCALIVGFTVPMASWMLYNWINAGYLLKGLEVPSQTSLLTNIETVARGTFTDLWPLLVLTLLAYLLVGRYSLRGFLNYFTDRDGLLGGHRRDQMLIMSCWVIFYCSFLVVIASIIDIYDMRFLNRRLLVPFYPFLIVILLVILHHAYSLRFDTHRIPRLVYLALFSAAVILGGKHLLREIDLTSKYKFQDCALYRWIESETGGKDLFVGNSSWHITFYTGRPVLESGYPEMPSLKPQAVIAFLEKFKEDYGDAYYVLIREAGERLTAEDTGEYAKAGFDLRPCGVFDSCQKEVEVYRIVKTAARSDASAGSRPVDKVNKHG